MSLNSAHSSEPDCDDFLSLINKKPDQLNFVSCEAGKSAQLRALKATYSVDGEHAKDVEAYLKKHFELPTLRFACCGWDTLGPKGSFSFQNYYVEVSMYSDETLIRERSRWKEIDHFNVQLTLLLESP